MGASALPDKLVEELHTAPRRKRKKEKSVKDKTKGECPQKGIKINLFLDPKRKKDKKDKKDKKKDKKELP